MSVVSRPGARQLVFAGVMLALTALFVALGLWQLQRLGEKEALIAAVTSRLDDPPQPLPAASVWPTLDPDELDYRRISVAGHFGTGQTVLVFTSLADPRGEHGGPGYWVMTPLVLDGGGTIFVNRGFVPQAIADDRAALEPMNPLTGSLELTGIARRPEEASIFTPAPDAHDGIDWIRDPERLAALAGIDPPVASVYLDLPAGAPGELPQGGETAVEFPNNHFGYALTWFGFATLTPILLLVWLRRQKSSAGP